jgi:hypothetical protein
VSSSVILLTTKVTAALTGPPTGSSSLDMSSLMRRLSLLRGFLSSYTTGLRVFTLYRPGDGSSSAVTFFLPLQDLLELPHSHVRLFWTFQGAAPPWPLSPWTYQAQQPAVAAQQPAMATQQPAVLA